MKLKKKLPFKDQRLEKIALNGKLAALLDQYGQYYEETYQEKITAPELIVEQIKAFMQSDRDFLKWTKSRVI